MVEVFGVLGKHEVAAPLGDSEEDEVFEGTETESKFLFYPEKLAFLLLDNVLVPLMALLNEGLLLAFADDFFLLLAFSMAFEKYVACLLVLHIAFGRSVHRESEKGSPTGDFVSCLPD